ncbi:MAG: hypothetical protein IT208_11220 [Chthonomonadales bacterium]|nr:hypothetical protein [Chthonomonadales bacterium]
MDRRAVRMETERVSQLLDEMLARYHNGRVEPAIIEALTRARLALGEAAAAADEGSSLGDTRDPAR